MKNIVNYYNLRCFFVSFIFLILHFIANNYIRPITDALIEFGAKQGYTLDPSFYEDLAWGGLSNTPAFNNYQHQDRANNVILIELTKKDMNGDTKPQKGEDAGC